MNRNEIKGKAETIKGKIKQAAGDLSDDETLRDEGVADEVLGRARESFGREQRKMREAVENIGKSIKR
jgi:uncharacterized protein YjbJ (UPF0337 family)